MLRQRFSLFLDRTRHWTEGTQRLIAALWGSRSGGGSDDWRSVLQQQATTHNNPFAQSIVRWQRTLHLLQYHGGATAYWQAHRHEHPWILRLLSGASSSSSSSSTSDGTPTQATARCTSSTTPHTAKVAFMITSTMKQELQQDLGYDRATIRTMTPLEAQLVLEHRVAPEAYATQIPLLREAWHNDNERRQQTLRMQQQQQQQQTTEDVATRIASASATQPEIEPTTSEEHQPTPPPTSVAADRRDPVLQLTAAPPPTTDSHSPPTTTNTTTRETANEAASAFLTSDPNGDATPTQSTTGDAALDPSSTTTTTWYQVVELPSERVVALCLHSKEADECRAIHAELAAQHASSDAPPAVSYETRTIVK